MGMVLYVWSPDKGPNWCLTLSAGRASELALLVRHECQTEAQDQREARGLSRYFCSLRSVKNTKLFQRSCPTDASYASVRIQPGKNYIPLKILREKTVSSSC